MIDIIGIVEKLNEEIEDNPNIGNDAEPLRFSYITDGYTDIVEFGGIHLWNDDNEERHYDEETDEFESLESFLRKQFNNLKKYINEIKL